MNGEVRDIRKARERFFEMIKTSHAFVHD
jgi:hypothetical protein